MPKSIYLLRTTLLLGAYALSQIIPTAGKSFYIRKYTPSENNKKSYLFITPHQTMSDQNNDVIQNYNSLGGPFEDVNYVACFNLSSKQFGSGITTQWKIQASDLAQISFHNKEENFYFLTQGKVSEKTIKMHEIKDHMNEIDVVTPNEQGKNYKTESLASYLASSEPTKPLWKHPKVVIPSVFILIGGVIYTYMQSKPKATKKSSKPAKRKSV